MCVLARPFLAAALLAAAFLVSPAFPPEALAQSETSAGSGLLVPFGDVDRGRKLFVGKGCVVCHSINGIGGLAGPTLDADPNQPYVNIYDFAARMWRGASTMITLQEMELGYQIELTGEELTHITRFVFDAEAQKSFSQDDIPELIRDWMLDEIYEELEMQDMAQ